VISVLILTKNEEANLPRLLAACTFSDDIVVVDSGSTDATLQIAHDHGARVFFREWDNERAQREYALKEPKFKYPWVYNPDADEVPEPDLIREMLSVAANPGVQENGFRVRFKNMFMGKWIKHSSIYPTWVLRLVRPDKVSMDRDINLIFSVDGKEGTLAGHFLHYSFNKGLEDWLAKHNRYSTFEAVENIKHLTTGHLDIAGLLSAFNPVRRRKALKELSFRLPCRPALRFLYMYCFRLGFLDGAAGYHYCRLLAYYEYMIVLKMREIRLKNLGNSL